MNFKEFDSQNRVQLLLLYVIFYFYYISGQLLGLNLFLQMYSFFHKRAGGQFGKGISMQPILVQQPACLHESCKPLSFTHKQF